MTSFDDLIKWLWLMLPLFFSPGPANLALASASSRSGFRAVLPFICGLLAVDLVVVPLLGLGCGALFKEYPYIFRALETAGVIYVFYLAQKIFRSKSTSTLTSSENLRGFGFSGGVVLQLLNGKLLAMIMMMYSQFLEDPKNIISEVLILTLMFNIGATSAHLSWGKFGAFLREILKSSRAQKIQRWTFSLLLLFVSMWLLYENIRSWNQLRQL
jgi:threonine/homoserine/homoserine lactone efflux protein